jgi:3-hydroxy-9,10-secoandrosta-1,3,5(10)-triene-9,17-dione monooxygenase reductase component
MSIDSNRYRQVLGHFPTGVTVITGAPDGRPVGLTIGSFSSVSLEPPLVGFLPQVSSDRWPEIEASGAFCVNILGAHQGELCWRFARAGTEDMFTDVRWEPAPVTGSPIVDGVIAWMDCTIYKVVEAGDHWFVMGEIQQFEHLHPDEDPLPLLFYRGKLGGFLQQ